MLNALQIKRMIIILIISTYIVQAKRTSTTQIQPFTLEFWIFLFISVFLILFAGLCSGLTVGYLSIKKQTLILWLDSNQQLKILKAKRILEILQNHHLLLSTLLLSNAISMQALPIFLDKIVPSYLAIIISTASVLIFGQVVPQAYCTGRNQIQIAYYMAPFVKFLEIVLGIFVKPIAWFLDHWLGVHQQKIILTKQTLKTLLKLHNNKEYGYRTEEIEMLQNTLDLRTKKISDHMIPINRIFMIDSDSIINEELIKKVTEYNYSVIPLYSPIKNCIIGTIYAKDLIGVDITCNYKIQQKIKIEPATFISQRKNLLEAFDLMKTKKKKICFILKELKSNKYYSSQINPTNKQDIIGIIILKKIFEEITLQEFQDDDQRKKLQSKNFDFKLSRKPKKSEQIKESTEQD